MKNFILPLFSLVVLSCSAPAHAQSLNDILRDGWAAFGKAYEGKASDNTNDIRNADQVTTQHGGFGQRRTNCDNCFNSNDRQRVTVTFNNTSPDARIVTWDLLDESKVEVSWYTMSGQQLGTTQTFERQGRRANGDRLVLRAPTDRNRAGYERLTAEIITGPGRNGDGNGWTGRGVHAEATCQTQRNANGRGNGRGGRNNDNKRGRNR